ncbi:MAG: hypothetical protein LBU73_03280 [Helicobacteraceae bacterium]|jgi:hypothetical protein|nr:hypothetical protein [Helicobacteraceae bacterium]
MGTIKTGFWQTKFIITPTEFHDFLKLSEKYDVKFAELSYGYPQKTTSEILQKYTMSYEAFTSIKNDSEFIKTISCAMEIEFEKYKSSFHLLLDRIQFYKNNVLARDEIHCLRISFPKGYAVNYEDEKGKYFVYEDINKHEPEMYPIFETLSKHIKQFTKPFRFEIAQRDKIEAQKPSSVRISRQAAEDYGKSWLFKEYQLKMKSFEK